MTGCFQKLLQKMAVASIVLFFCSDFFKRTVFYGTEETCYKNAPLGLYFDFHCATCSMRQSVYGKSRD